LEGSNIRKETLLKITAIALFIHGVIEILAAMMLFALAEFLLVDFQEQSVFWAVLVVRLAW